MITRYGELLANDGLVRFGFGLQDNSAEIMSDSYNVVSIYTNDKKYSQLFQKLSITRSDKIKTAWDTFSADAPGKCSVIEVDGKSIFDLPEELKDKGIYFYERREDD